MADLEKRANEEIEGKKENGVGEVLSEFALSTTAHGVGHIAASSHSHIKIAWFLTWLGVMAAFAYMIVKLILLYTSYPVSTSINMAYHQYLAFPGITVCNLNILRASQIKNLTSGRESILQNEMRNTSTLTGVFQSSQPSMSSAELASLRQDDVESGRAYSIARINLLPVDVLKERGHQFKEFVTKCSWAGLLCHEGLLLRNWKKLWHWKYGNCFTFNGQSVIEGSNGSLHGPLKSNIAYSSDGLTLTFDVQMKEYTPLAMEEGIRVLIEDQDSSLYPEKHGFSIRPGAIANIALKKLIIQREDVYNNGSCRERSHDQTKYTLQSCITGYKGATQLLNCNCTEVQYFQIVKARPCKGTRDDSCIASVNKEFAKESSDLGRNCPPPCSEVMFEKTITQGKIFAEGYLKTYGIPGMTEDYVAKNIIQLHLHYEDQTVGTIKTESYYKFDNLISDVGGQLGLWIGVSAVTVIEFFALSWNLILYFANKRRKRGIRSLSK